MINVQLKPADVWFFSNSTPFSTGTAAQSEPGGVFPPHPTTIAGALRPVLARENGWTGQGYWPRELFPILGDGPSNLGSLRLSGPYLLLNGEPVFPMPRHVLGLTEKGVWRPRALARPGSPITCDLGEHVRLPEWPEDGTSPLKENEKVWVRANDLQTILSGSLPIGENGQPFKPIRQDELWVEERRVGIALDRKTRTAEKRQLYSALHIRLQPNVSLGVQCFGLPDDWTLSPGTTLTLGGESRLATCHPWAGPPAWLVPVEPAKNGRLAVVALTPLDLTEKGPLLGRVLTTLGGVKIVSACLGKSRWIGGWDARNRKPLTNRCLLPAGSVLFCEPGSKKYPLRPDPSGRFHIGRRRNMGFGSIALGTWTEEKR